MRRLRSRNPACRGHVQGQWTHTKATDQSSAGHPGGATPVVLRSSLLKRRVQTASDVCSQCTEIVAIATATTTTQRWIGGACGRWFGSVRGRGRHGVVVEQPPREEGPDRGRHSQPVCRNRRHRRRHHRHSKVDGWCVWSTVRIGVGARPAWGRRRRRPARKQLPGEDGGGDRRGCGWRLSRTVRARAMLQSSEEVGLSNSESLVAGWVRFTGTLSVTCTHHGY